MAVLTVYDLHKDHQRISWLQEATTTTRHVGLEPTHGLFGSRDWWRNIELGRLPVFKASGVITEVYHVGEGDFPEFAMIDDEGIETSWKREANYTEDDDFYVIGRRVELTYVLQRARMDLADLGLEQTEKCILTLQIDVPRSRTYRSANGAYSRAVRPGRSLHL
jgi:hypothetical protein